MVNMNHRTMSIEPKRFILSRSCNTIITTGVFSFMISGTKPAALIGSESIDKEKEPKNFYPLK